MTPLSSSLILISACFLLNACAPENSVLLLQDVPLEEIFHIQNLKKPALQRQLARIGYSLKIETVSLEDIADDAQTDDSPPTDMLTSLGNSLKLADIIIISPLLENYIDDLLEMSKEESIILSLGQAPPDNEYSNRVWGIDLVPDLADALFLAYLTNDDSRKAAIYDPGYFIEFSETLIALSEAVADNLLFSMETFESDESILQTWNYLQESSADHLILILRANELNRFLSESGILLSEESPDLISTILPVFGPVIGGFPFQYNYIIPAAVEKLHNRGGNSSGGNGKIRIHFPFIEPN